MSSTPKKGSHHRSSSDSELIITAASTPAPPSSTSESGIEDRIDSPVASVPVSNTVATSPAVVAPSAGTTTNNAAGNGIVALGPAALAIMPPSVPLPHFLLRQAQMIFGPEACVFVGNLPYEWPDPVLTVAVDNVMQNYGLCLVGIFRDVWWKPYAIVQYTTEGDAVHAMISSVYMDRPLRVERSNRSRY